MQTARATITVLQQPCTSLRSSRSVLLQLADQMIAAAAGQQTPKIRLFSGHDTTVLPFLRILQHDIATWPPYVANVTFQLWQDRSHSQHIVKALYNGKALPLGPDGASCWRRCSVPGCLHLHSCGIMNIWSVGPRRCNVLDMFTGTRLTVRLCGYAALSADHAPSAHHSNQKALTFAVLVF